jgi:hypothetical protein
MNLHLNELGGRQWVVLLFLVAVLFLAEAFICAAIGLFAASLKGSARLLFWPIALVLVIAMLPGFLLAAMLYGFMRPPYGGHLLPSSEQSWPQRGINGLIELIGGRSVTAESAVMKTIGGDADATS